MKWLLAEYKEPITLTKKQNIFLELLETGYLFKSCSGKLNWSEFVPFYDKKHVLITQDKGMEIPEELIKMDFIETGKSYSVKDMLKWEVEE